MCLLDFLLHDPETNDQRNNTALRSPSFHQGRDYSAILPARYSMRRIRHLAVSFRSIARIVQQASRRCSALLTAPADPRFLRPCHCPVSSIVTQLDAHIGPSSPCILSSFFSALFHPIDTHCLRLSLRSRSRLDPPRLCDPRLHIDSTRIVPLNRTLCAATIPRLLESSLAQPRYATLGRLRGPAARRRHFCRGPRHILGGSRPTDQWRNGIDQRNYTGDYRQDVSTDITN